MKIGVSDLTTDRKWRSAIGLDKDEFFALLPLFGSTYEQIYGKSIELRQADNPAADSAITKYEDLLFFTLFSLKSGLTVRHFRFSNRHRNGSSAKRNQDAGITVLRCTLGKRGLSGAYYSIESLTACKSLAVILPKSHQ
ncbi:MAG: hypothetical protein LC116_10320 [Bacteroidetes bacterium]|jgi:hypothetical protein|nr:hypothetical protein [Bacteroidota bacterium]MCZ2133544.1 hypothetical protein [Bacteroidota bacterium]